MTRKIYAFILILFYSVSFAAYTADIAPKLQEFYSPRLFGTAAASTLLYPPQSSIQNPASAALAQRMTFDGNYVAIVGEDDTSSGWNGHVLNFGHTIPSKVGVFTWNSSVLRSTFDSLDTGTRLSLHGSFAKDIYPDTLVGIGIGTSMAEGPEFGIDADLGLIRVRPALWFLEDVRWSVVLNNFGYSGIEGLREPLYSVTSGVNGRFLNTDKVEGRLMSEIKVPEFSNVIWSTGMKFQIGYGFEASLGTRVNADALLDGEIGELIPSVTLGYTFSPGSSNAEKTTEDLSAAERFTQNELQPYASAAPISSELWAFGVGLTVPIGLIDTEPPEIQIDLSGVTTQYSEEPEETPQAGQDADEGEVNDVEDESSESTAGENSEISSEKVSSLSEKTVIRALAGKGSKHSASGKSVVYIADNPENEKDVPEKDNGNGGDSASEAELTEELIKNVIPDAKIYLSPNNDGIQDSLSFPLSIDESRYIKGYEFVVENSQGEAVRTLENKETRPEKRTVKTFFQNLFKSKSAIQIPKTLRWDGTTDSGETAPDGLYYFYIRAWDDNGNYGTSDRYSVYVDTQPPIVRIEKEDQADRIFSPNDDGQKDVLPITQNGSREDLWRGRIKDSSGNVVKTKTWKDSPPESFEWDGTNNEDILVPDGVYEYSITSTDKAGNNGEAEYGNLVKNTEETPISLSIDHSHFSPNGDGILDVVLLQPNIPVQRGIESWTIKIVDESGREYRSFSGTSGLSGVIPFDGKDDNGDILPENREYFADLQVLYINGNRPTTRSAPFIVDITAPEARIEIDNRVFSPNGDGNKDTIKIHQEASKEENWYGTITDIDGNPVYQYKWIEQPEQTISWDGRKEDGSLAEDGYYFYQLTTVDRAGNRGESRKIRFELNTEETPVLFTANYDYFSPNGDGSKDTIKFFPKLKIEEGVEKYILEVMTENTEVVFSRSGTGTLPDSLLWDGFSSEGDRVKDGRYRARIDVLYANGNNPTAETQFFTVDTVFPSITVEPEYFIFSPEGDGNRDTIIFAQNSSSEQLWDAEVLSSEGDVVSSASWKGKVEDYVWDGTDKAGNSVDDGFYSYRIFSTDRAGNTAEERVENIEIDTAPTQLFVTAGSDKLAPTGNGLYEEISFSTIVNRREGLEEWSLELVDNRGIVQKEFAGEERIPKQIVWDGKNEEGDYVEGRYKARFSARYTKGNRPSVESLPFVLDVTAPQADVNLEPTPFSPDNDGIEDELSIMLKVSDQNAVQDWKFTIYDAERAGVTSQDGPVFKQYSGRGEPAEEIIWDGRSDDGELVYAAMDYPYRFEVTDSLGNRTVENGKIPVDVLVVREGDVLKIKIASINFKPNSAEFVDDKPEIASRNQYVLDRLAEILKKYRQYEITIEGHANITKFWDPELARQEQINELIPLSEERAKRVLEALAERGISRSRLSAEGVGGSKPIVDFQDEDNRWKNRRVEFILEKD
ncbi:MAG: FlgD immunoglobulin-like domain containing protein [Spirochaetia bacterium]|nr:FlgD immunoglobulin-like domain containing protein [Spirochaetia bacterium]